MTEREDSDAIYGENQMEEEEEEDNVRTMNCLRGRLLAERMASRNAREEADKLGKKLVELENLLKEEAKSRNRAEKKLKFLMKRLESMNISYVTDESQSSAKATSSSSRTKVSENQESMENDKSPKGSQNSPLNDSQLGFLCLNHDGSTNEGSSISAFDINLAEMGSNENPKQQNYNGSTTDEQRHLAYHGSESSEEGLKHNWMAIVPVEIPEKNESIDPEVLDATVKEVLDALRHAKEQLQSSMERRRVNMIRVG